MLPRVVQPSFSAGEISPYLYGRVDFLKYQTGLKTAKNVFCLPHGGVTNRPGTKFVGEVSDSSRKTRLIRFQFSTQQAYALEFGHQTMRVIRNGGYVVQTAKTITGITQASPGVVTSASHGFSNGDEIVISGVSGMTELNGRNFIVAGATTNTFTLTDLFGNAIDTTGFTAYTSGGSAARIYEISTPYDEDDLFTLVYVQSADVMYLTHPSYAVRKLSRIAEDNWTIGSVTFLSAQAAPTSPSSSAGGTLPGTTTSTSYVITAVNDETGEESLPSADTGLSTPLETNWPADVYVYVSWTAAAGADRYNIYKGENGYLGYIGSAIGTGFRDINISPDFSRTPPVATNPFGGAGDYPACAAFFEQRLFMAGADDRPASIDGSRTGRYENFNRSAPARDDDAVAFTLVSREVNRIRHMVALGDLIVFTSAAEWRISSGSQSDVITPSSVQNRPQSYRGSGTVAPIVVGDTALYVQARGNVVRDLRYTFETDGYQGTDLSILSSHLFEGHQIIDWAYAQDPDSILWVIRDDGVMLSLTYIREQEIFAWCRHETDGLYESVVSLAEDEQDGVYVVVKRTVNGATKRYVERMESRRVSAIEDAFFVDSGLTYDGSAVSSITGLHHLEGKTVVALCDGNVVRDLTVSNGAVTFSQSFSKIQIGLPYTSDVETLPIDLGVVRGQGSVQGRKIRIPSVTIRVKDTRGIFYGPDADSLIEYKQRAAEAWSDPIAMFTGDIQASLSPQWSSQGKMFFRQSDPLPMTILAVIPEVAVGG